MDNFILKKLITCSAIMLFCNQTGWSDITITMVDEQNSPIEGVSCTQSGGGPTAVSDASGTLILRGLVSLNQLERPQQNLNFSQIPIAPGENAVITVNNTKGQQVMKGSLLPGGQLIFSEARHGVYYVTIRATNIVSRGHFVNLGRQLVFRGVALQGNTGLLMAKNSADLGIVCSKSGYYTQVYQLADGSSHKINFSNPAIVPMYDAPNSDMQADIVIDTEEALITRWADRARDRHAREDEFKTYDHYLALYWQLRTAKIIITDRIAKGGDAIEINVYTEWKLDAPEFRAFYRGIGTVAEYCNNTSMNRDPADVLHYSTTLSYNCREGRAIQIGDEIEIEVSQFLDAPFDGGRDNYYGTTVLYIVGEGGFSPWEAHGVFGDASTERENSHPIPIEGWLGGKNTLPYQYSDEPDDHFLQMSPNLSADNGQVFVNGRRVFHTDMVTGRHDESPDNGTFELMTGNISTNYVNASCHGCHVKNGRGLAPPTGTVLTNYVVKTGDGNGNPHPQYGGLIQPQHAVKGPAGGDGTVYIQSWIEENGLRRPVLGFGNGPVPEQHSARVTPQLVGMGLLEAIPEIDIQALADPDDLNGDGISGRVRIVPDLATGVPRLGRFGWKAGNSSVKYQAIGALHDDMGVMSALKPDQDCGSAQTGCGESGAKIDEEQLMLLADYVSLLGVSARRDLRDPVALQGEELFASAGCVACHIPTMKTTPFHRLAELRSQTIHPYSDLLLHDMGPGLADNLGEGTASGSEWRTPPLWNIGLTDGVSGGEGYLHDGRARTLSEAILWHGGEGLDAKNNFSNMSESDKNALIQFLKSL